MAIFTQLTRPVITAATSANSEYAPAASALVAEHASNPVACSVIVTSVSPGQGTTSSAVEIATCLAANYDRRALVVEINFARPALQRLFNVPRERSLAAFGLDANLDAVAFEVKSGVDVLPCGPTGFDWLSALRLLMEQAAHRYDMVIIDAPPVLRSSDALAAASIVPRMLLIVESGRTSRKNLLRVQDRISTAGARLMGAILTKEKPVLPRWLLRWMNS